MFTKVFKIIIRERLSTLVEKTEGCRMNLWVGVYQIIGCLVEIRAGACS
jgi:hypothetical protein